MKFRNKLNMRHNIIWLQSWTNLFRKHFYVANSFPSDRAALSKWRNVSCPDPNVSEVEIKVNNKYYLFILKPLKEYVNLNILWRIRKVIYELYKLSFVTHKKYSLFFSRKVCELHTVKIGTQCVHHWTRKRSWQGEVCMARTGDC